MGLRLAAVTRRLSVKLGWVTRRAVITPPANDARICLTAFLAGPDATLHAERLERSRKWDGDDRGEGGVRPGQRGLIAYDRPLTDGLVGREVTTGSDGPAAPSHAIVRFALAAP